MTYDLIRMIVKRHSFSFILDTIAAETQTDSIQDRLPPTEDKVKIAAIIQEAADKVREIEKVNW